MKRILVLVLAGGWMVLAASGVSGQEIRYRAEISAADRVNSRGGALKTLREFLRQDRFNLHGGHHVDPGDTKDTRFSTKEARGLIDGARLVAPPGLEAGVIEGRVTRLEITVSGTDKSLLLRVAPAPEEVVPAQPDKTMDTTPVKSEAAPAPAPPKGFRIAYTTTLGQQDWTDSNGIPWSRLRDVLKQDRANVNRLGRHDPGDERDVLMNSASERRLYDTVPLLLDPALAGPLARRETVKVMVFLGREDGRLLVTRPGAESAYTLQPLEDLLAEKQWKANAAAVSGDVGAVTAARELVELADLVHGREHEDAAMARVHLANLLFETNRGDEAKPLLAEIERDFRAAAGREVDPDSIVAVMGFLVRARLAVGEAEAAKKLLEELLDPPGREKWRLDEAHRAELEKLRASPDAAAPAEDDRPTYEEALAEWERTEKDPATPLAERLKSHVAVIFVHPKHEGPDYELLLERLRTRVSEIDRGSVDDILYLPLADALLTLAYDEFRKADFDSARRRCEDALSFLNVPVREEQLPALSARQLLVRIATAQGKTDEAEALALRDFQWGRERFQTYDGRLLDLGRTYFELLSDRGDGAAIEAAGKDLAEVTLANQEIPMPYLRASWHETIAGMAFEAGDAERADSWSRKLVDAIAKDPALLPALGESYSHWGFLYESKGQYGRAEEIWTEGAAVLETLDDRVGDYVSLLQDLSLVRKHYRDEQGAIDLIEKARVIAAAKLGTDSMEYAVACNNLVLPLNALGRGEDALRRVDEALAIAAAHPDREWGEESGLIFRNNRAILLMNSDPAGAAEIYAEIVAKMEAMGQNDSHRLALFLINLGNARRETGRYDEAEEALLRALGILRDQGWEDRRNLAIILDALAALSMRKGRVAEAVGYVRESVELAEAFLRNASAIATESEKLALGSLFTYGKHVHILLAAGETEEACELSLRSKGTVLDQSIREARARRRISDDAGMRRIFAELGVKQRQLNRVSLALQHGGGPVEGGAALAGLRQEVKRLQAALLGEEGAAGIDPDAGEAITLSTVRKRLGEEERFYEFVEACDETGETYFGAFEIKADSVRWVRLVTSEMARIAVTDFRGAVDAYLAARSDEVLAEAGPRLEAASRKLNELFWAPLAPPREEGKRVVLCPDGILHFVPFAVLLDGENQFPGEVQVFDYVGSARDFCRRDSGAKRDLASAVVVGGPDYGFPLAGETKGGEAKLVAAASPRLGEETLARSGIGRSGAVSLAPLPGAVKEAGLIAETLEASGSKVSLFTAAEATELALTGAVGPGIVHVATHGIFFDLDFGSVVSGGFRSGVDPMLRGALALTGAQSAVGSWEKARFPDAENDGWLFAAEAVQLDLRGTELVTLSACETGIGDLASGEGVIGLRRAFLAAGARHVLSTLWPISDEMTVELMRDFYERLGRGEMVTTAFSGAQGEALRVFRGDNARAEAIALFGAFVLNRAGN